jgi:hypothetical protein
MGGEHFRELGSSATRHLGHAELLQFCLELIELTEKFIPALRTKLVSLNLDCSQIQYYVVSQVPRL